MEKERRDKGFTLVELSIVLVVIALLVGGILIGQDMIASGTTRKVVSEYTGISSGMNAFYGKYNCIPGDCYKISTYIPGETDGDGDETIESPASASATGESFQAWKQLAGAGLYSGSFNGLSGAGGASHAVIGTNVPVSKVSSSAGYAFGYLSTQSGSASYYDGSYGNLIYFGAATSTSTLSSPSVKPTQAYEIDKKIDDGIPGIGKVKTWLNSAANGWYCSTVGSSVASPSTSAYDLANNKTECSLIFLIGW